MRIALIGAEAAGARILQALARGAHEVVAVVCSGPTVTLAERLGYRPLAAARVREPAFAAELAAIGVDLLLNVHSLYVLPEAVLRVPALGAWNLHPGPLPRYAGLNAPSWAIYRGEVCHGVSVHRMEADIDTGDIAYQESFPISDADTGLSVALRCAQLGVALMQRLLEDATSGAVPRLAQDPAQRTYFGRGVPQGGRIDWQAPARRIFDFVRACDYHPFASPWGVPRAGLAEREVEIRKVALTGEACAQPPGTLRSDRAGHTRVACADQWLRLDAVRSVQGVRGAWRAMA
jgi:methionyl-tRNA formyltransferase